MSNESRKVSIVTFGCQMNKLDSELLAGALADHGYAVVDDPEDASIVLYNTCSVRRHAEEKAFSHIGSFRRRAEREDDFVLGVIGCMAQRMGEDLTRRFDHVKLVCGTRQFPKVPTYLEEIKQGDGPIVAVDDDAEVDVCRNVEARPQSHHAYVSIMRGCDHFCAYCIVPYVRGREVSRRPAQVIEEVKRLADDGVREVTLLGQNVDSYAKDFEDASLPDLLEKLNDVPGLQRIRFVTNHPADMSEDILRAVADLPKVCEHLHVPAQSGSDRILERMKRGYTSGQYRDLIHRAKELIPEVEVASDFMVGFPGETAEDFEQTLGMVRDMRFQQCFMFKYSPRPGTLAAKWEDDVPRETKQEWLQRLLSAQADVDLERRHGLIGEVKDVLVDGVSKQDETNLSGRTRQNDIVVFEGSRDLEGEIRPVEIVDTTRLTLFGKIVNN